MGAGALAGREAPFDNGGQRTVRWWSPGGNVYELTVGNAPGAAQTWSLTDLDAIVRSFEPAPDGAWRAPQLGRDPLTTTTVLTGPRDPGGTTTSIG